MLKRMYESIFKTKVFYKMLLSYFLSAIIPAFIIAMLSYNASVNYINKQSIINLKQVQEKTIINLNGNLTKFENLCDNIYYDQKMQDFLAGSYSEMGPDFYEEYILLQDYIRPKLSASFAVIAKNLNLSLVRYKNELGEVISPDFDSVFKDSGQSNKDLLEEGMAQNFQIYNLDRVENTSWFNQARGDSYSYRWMQLNKDARYDNISIVREIRRFNSQTVDTVGLLKLTVRLQDIIEQETPEDPGAGFTLIFDENNGLLSTEKEKRDFAERNLPGLAECLSAPDREMDHVYKDIIILKSVMEHPAWKVLTVYPILSLRENVALVRNITIISFIISFLIMFSITFKLSSVFSRRIVKIYNAITQFEEKNINYTGTLDDSHPDEIGYLAKAFNSMTSQINSLIKDVYQADIDRKESELQVLQAQINPHFLYNSLSAVKRLAENGDVANISFIVKSLTRFFRIALNNGMNILSVGDEIEQITAFLDIHKVRKGEYFRITYDIDPRVTGYRTLKLVLQPFVENIFEHAIYDRTTPINIKISAEKAENSIVFKIIDDGVGIPEARLQKLFINSSSGYGIKNVNERIKLHYGCGNGVEIFSRPGIGTTVTITIPTDRDAD